MRYSRRLPGCFAVSGSFSVVDNVILPRICWVSSRPFLGSARVRHIMYRHCGHLAALQCRIKPVLLSNKGATFSISFQCSLNSESGGGRCLLWISCCLPVCRDGWHLRWFLPVPIWTIPSVLRRCRCRAALAARSSVSPSWCANNAHISRALARRSYGFCFEPAWKSFEFMQHPCPPFGCL